MLRAVRLSTQCLGDVKNPKELKLAPERVGAVQWVCQRDPGRVVEYWEEREVGQNIPEGQKGAELWRGVSRKCCNE